ncbi:exodeoxyribonuclease V subunit beta [Buchnera aphidicola (Neophyllaphis podocarpi)]|uniref:exodeoxyribonuclease V subunit beta n=1 Tax=Buchnera aphidicola TaxID=9 RepID=UPI0031B81269
MLKKIKDIKQAISLLIKAENTLENSSIYTIHSFCKKILEIDIFQHEYITTNNRIIYNVEEIYETATTDFWRENFYNLSTSLTNIIHKEIKNPKNLLDNIKPYLNNTYVDIKYPNYTKYQIKYINKKILSNINIFKKYWIDNKIILIKNIISKIKNEFYKKTIINYSKKISNWAKNDVLYYKIPKELEYFSIKEISKKNKIINSEGVFFLKNIENFLKKPIFLIDTIYAKSIKEIRKKIKKIKKQISLIEFSDIVRLSKYILTNKNKSKNILKYIRKIYPIAIVDEFQDTDNEQNIILKEIYINSKNVILILVGDPKQSIYNFRGSNIFNYFNIKSKIKNHYYLNNNWRSSKNMISSINYLFSRIKKPFFIKELEFVPVKYTKDSNKIKIEVNNKEYSALKIWIHKNYKTNIEEYTEWSSKICAKEINYLLQKSIEGKAILKKGKITKKIKEKDIVILVNNKNEALKIQQAMNKYNINTLYLSEKNSVFSTLEAKEILWILQALANPPSKKTINQVLLSSIFQNKIKSLDKYDNNKKYNYQNLAKKLYEYKIIWNTLGILELIKSLIEYMLKYNLNKYFISKQKINNFLHLGELIQKKSEKIKKKTYLIYWMQRKITNTKKIKEEEIIKNNDFNSVIINTIHKSKGMQYPIVWFPFAVNFLKIQNGTYYNPKTKKNTLNFKITKKNINKHVNEIMSEKLRLIYVALTRSIWHCSLSISQELINDKNIKYYKNYNIKYSSPIGYLLKNNKDLTINETINKLIRKKNSNIEILTNSLYKKEKNIEIKSNIIDFKKTNTDINLIKKEKWSILSYSGIKKNNKLEFNNNKLNKNIKNKNNLTIKNFPQGLNTGLLMHEILKKINFKQKIKIKLIYQILKKYNFNNKWLNIVLKWTKYILNKKLNVKNLCLHKIKEENLIKELNFYLLIKNRITEIKFNELIKKFDNISNISKNIKFTDTKGIFYGKIDLIFKWNKKYYILDYKSNWIGENNQNYKFDYLITEIKKYRYDIQYHIYSLALHRYLKSKIKKYDFKKYFGGIFYFFIRAAKSKNIKEGIFYKIPEENLIKSLDKLFN